MMISPRGTSRPRVLATLSGGFFLFGLLTNVAWVCRPFHASFAASRAQSRIALRQQIVNVVPREVYPYTDQVTLDEQQRKAVDADQVTLDEQQRKAVDAVMEGRSVLITGGAGVGKSATVQEILKRLEDKFGDEVDDKVVMTASTGVAAVQLGGCTLHCAAGIAVPHFVSDFKKIRGQIYREAWQQLEVLIIDEVSMISGEFFDLFEEEVRKLRGNDQPFGGLQLVLVGDFAQLPPVISTPAAEIWEQVDKKTFVEEKRALIQKGPKSHHELFLNRGMIFQSGSFGDLDLEVVFLTTPHRYRSDPELPELMRRLRSGSASELRAAVADLNEFCYRPSEIAAACDGGDNNQVWLFPTNERVDMKNKQKLDALPGEPVVFVAKDGQTPEDTENQTLYESRMQILAHSSFFDEAGGACGVPKQILLKRNALVMLTANVDTARGLVNGAVGRVVKLSKKGGQTHTWVRVDFGGIIGEVFINAYKFQWKIPGVGTCERTQVPLRLAWALTHHKSQGKTLNRVRVDPSGFTDGQAYVAVSRTRTLEGLTLLRPARVSDFKVNPAVLSWMQHVQHPHEPTNKKIGNWLDETVPWSAFTRRTSPWPKRV